MGGKKNQRGQVILALIDLGDLLFRLSAFDCPSKSPPSRGGGKRIGDRLDKL